MLQCVMSIVEKAKRAVSVLQERCIRDREEMATWARRMAEETEAEVRRKAGKQYFSIKYSNSDISRPLNGMLMNRFVVFMLYCNDALLYVNVSNPLRT